MAYVTAEARQELLDAVAGAIMHLAVAIAALGVAYEQLDERTADRLEDELFGPVQKAYGRARRTYIEFATRYVVDAQSFAPEAPRLPSAGVKGLLEAAADAVGAGEDELAPLEEL